MWEEGILCEGSMCERGLLSKALLNTGLRSLGVQGPVVWRLACFWRGGVGGASAEQTEARPVLSLQLRSHILGFRVELIT